MRLTFYSEGYQTMCDVAVESYRAKELGVSVSWRTIEQDKTSEIRVVGVTVPDEIKVGQPYDVTAEVWSTEPQKATLNLQQDEFPNGLEPSKEVELREGKNLIKFKSDAKHAGATTYRLTLARFEHDTEKQNNQAAMTAAVKGRPNVLYVEGGILGDPGQAGHLQRGLDAGPQARGRQGVGARHRRGAVAQRLHRRGRVRQRSPGVRAADPRVEQDADLQRHRPPAIGRRNQHLPRPQGSVRDPPGHQR